MRGGIGQGLTCRADVWIWVTVERGLIEVQGGRVRDLIYSFPRPLWLLREGWKAGEAAGEQGDQGGGHSSTEEMAK